MSRPPIPTLINGTIYPSQKAAAAALGVNPSTIWQAIERGTTDTIGVGSAAYSVRVWVDGVEYPSQSAAARALGLGLRTIAKARSKAIARGLDYVDATYGRVTWEAAETHQDGRKGHTTSTYVKTPNASQSANLGALR